MRKLIAEAARAASGGNLQPWQVYALTARRSSSSRGKSPKRLPAATRGMWMPNIRSIRRRRKAARHDARAAIDKAPTSGALAIDRNDAAARLNRYKRNYEFFNAPVALFIAIDRRLGPGQWADLGGYIHALMYLARGYGLDTCAQESWARMHRIVGPFVNMPPEQMLFCAVSIGYGDRAHPANSFRSPRAEPQEFCRFFGFD